MIRRSDARTTDIKYPGVRYGLILGSGIIIIDLKEHRPTTPLPVNIDETKWARLTSQCLKVGRSWDIPCAIDRIA